MRDALSHGVVWIESFSSFSVFLAFIQQLARSKSESRKGAAFTQGRIKKNAAQQLSKTWRTRVFFAQLPL